MYPPTRGIEDKLDWENLRSYNFISKHGEESLGWRQLKEVLRRDQAQLIIIAQF